MTHPSPCAAALAQDPRHVAMIEAARGVVPALRAMGESIADARRVPDGVMKLLYDAGLMNPLRPRRWGGRQLSAATVFHVVRELARGDGSTAWVYAVTNSHDHFIGLYPEEVQQAYWASELPLSASSYAPVGKAEPVSGGYRVTGRWSFSSGIENSGWVVVGAFTPGADGAPDLRFFLLPSSDYRIEDDWKVMGLAGTGSKSLQIEGVFVPEARALRQADIVAGTTPGAAVHAHDPLYRASAWPLFGPCITAPAVGLVQGAYEVTLEGVRQRAQRADAAFEARKTAGFMKLAEVSATVDAAALLYDRAMFEIVDHIERGLPLSVEMKARARRDQAYSTLLLRQAMATLMLMGGGMGIYEHQHVQRAFRDLQALSAHVGASWETTAIQYGSVLITEGGILEPLF